MLVDQSWPVRPDTAAPPLVAVIIPCYNQGHFLAEAVASVVNQTLDCWEIIIINDGSSDDTTVIAQRLIARLPQRRIRLIVQANAGLGASRNVGIAATSAPYVLPLDADDLLAPTFLAHTVPLLQQDATLGFVTTNVRFFGAENGFWSGGDPTRQRLIYDCRMVVTTLFRRTGWQQVGGFPTQRVIVGYEDWDFWLRMVACGWQGALVPVPLVWYRRAAGSMLTTAGSNDLQLRALFAHEHAALYPPAFQPWAAGVLRAFAAGRLHGLQWWRWYAAYALLVARHASHELPKTLLRPMFKGLGPRQQMFARRFARSLRLSRAR